MSSERFERQYEVIHDSNGFVMSNYPISFAGMSVFMRNDSDNPTTVQIQESADGITYNLVLFSSPVASGLPSVTMAGLSFAVILFVSDQKYVKISLTAENQAGVFMHLVQWPPHPREPGVIY